MTLCILANAQKMMIVAHVRILDIPVQLSILETANQMTTIASAVMKHSNV